MSKEEKRFNPGITEKVLVDLSRLLKEKKVSSIDEANKHLATITKSGPIPSSHPETPLEKAQELMYHAWDASGKKSNRCLIKCGDCGSSLKIYFGGVEDVDLEINGVLATKREWKRILLPLLKGK